MRFKSSIVRRVTLALTGVMMLAIAVVVFIAFLVHREMERRLVESLFHDTIEGKLYVLVDALGQDELTRKYGLVLLAMALVFMLLSYWVGVRVAKWVVLPLDALTNQLGQWVPGTSSFHVSRTDEIGRLKDAFNRVQHQVGLSIAREREFAANLHHEIRTPLARIRSDSELMLHSTSVETTTKAGVGTGTGTGTGADTARRLRRMIRSVDDITDALEGVYEIARAQQGVAETVTLRYWVEDVFAQLAPEAKAAKLTFENKVRVDHVVVVNSYALFTVICNLIRNAIAHAAPAQLSILSIDGGLAFVDTGVGIPPDDLPYVFDRYYSASLVDQAGGNPRPQSVANDHQPKGLGLAIAQQICATHGWEITVQSPVADNQGTVFYLRF